MKTATLNQTQFPQSGSVWQAIAALVRRAVKASARRRAQRLAAASLRGLSDRTLKDIGIHRTEISSVVQDITSERKR